MIKVVLIILGALLALILLLLLLLIFGRASIRLVYREDITMVLSVLGIRFKILPAKNKPKSEAAKRREALKKQKRKQKRELSKAENAGKPQPTLLDNLGIIFSTVKAAYRKLRGKLIIKVNRFSIHVATGDAAKTAILYGAVLGTCSIFWQWVHGVISPVRRKTGAMEVIPDYLSKKSRADIDILLGMRLMPALLVAYSAYRAFTENRAKAFRKAEKRAEEAERKKAESEAQS